MMTIRRLTLFLVFTFRYIVLYFNLCTYSNWTNYGLLFASNQLNINEKEKEKENVIIYICIIFIRIQVVYTFIII